jgi:hypothetical protein
MIVEVGILQHLVKINKYINMPTGIYKRTLEHRRKNSEAQKKIGNKPPSWKGKHHKEESKRKIGDSCRGEKSHFWKGGISKINRTERENFNTSPECKLWRKSVFERDNYTCQECGARNGNGKTIVLQAHHIKSWSEFPLLRLIKENGITLCKECHKLTDSYGIKLIQVH